MIKQNFAFLLLFTINLTYLYAQKSVNQLDINGKRHGLWTKNYFQTDQKRYEGMFKHGKEIDTFKYYRLNKGVSVLSAIKVFNEKDSLADVVFYASNKKVISRGKMNGKRYIGKWTYYHNNSDQIMSVENYNDKGELHGDKLTYFINGTIAEQAMYYQGELNGNYKWFSENGILLKESNYKNGKLDGITLNYNAKGIIESEGHYKEDAKFGIWKYYQDGKLKKEIDHTTQKVLRRYD